MSGPMDRPARKGPSSGAQERRNAAPHGGAGPAEMRGHPASLLAEPEPVRRPEHPASLLAEQAEGQAAAVLPGNRPVLPAVMLPVLPPVLRAAGNLRLPQELRAALAKSRWRRWSGLTRTRPTAICC